MAEEKKDVNGGGQENDTTEKTESKGVELTPDKVEEYLESEQGKKILQPRLDKYFTKGLETWKEKTLPDVVEQEIKKKFPEETEEQKKLRQLEEKLQQAESARLKESARNKALSYASANGIPSELVDYAVQADVDKTMENVQSLANIWKESIKKAVEGKFKESGRDIQEPEKTPADLKDQIRAAEEAGDFKKSIMLKSRLMKKNKGE